MKKNSAVLMILVFAGLFLTSCEKEALLPTPGNSNTTTPTMKTGEGDDEDGSDIDDDDLGGGDTEGGITDGGRDEDYDKSGKKKPKALN